jgi:PAS domain S-box-containing protein
MLARGFDKKGRLTVTDHTQQHAIIIADTNGVIQLWSTAASMLFGHSDKEAVGQKLDLVVPEEYRDHHWKGFHAAMKRGTANAEGEFFDAPALCRSGEVKTLRGQLHVLRDEQKNAIGAMAIFAAG